MKNAVVCAFSGHSGKDGSSVFKAALLSGPPGVGKTTSASLVCQEKGFTYIELNASDARNKKTLQETVKDALANCDIASLVKGWLLACLFALYVCLFVCLSVSLFVCLLCKLLCKP